MIRIGTRTSRLAMIQTEIVKKKILEAFPDEQIEIVPIITKGDIELNRSLASFGGKGVFTQEIEEQLLTGKIDLAVHSAKDVPMELAKGLCLGAVLEREDCADVLVTRLGIKAKDMAAGSLIGTSSLRRELQVKRINPGLKVASLRGNVPTRLQKLRDGQYDGIVLAAAGLKRLGLDKEPDLFYEYFDTQEFLPAAGQGILAVEIRENSFKEVMGVLDCKEARQILFAERRFLTVLGGSCNAPCGVCCEKLKDGYSLSGMYAANGKNPVYITMNTSELKKLKETQSASQEISAEGLADEVAKRLKVQRVSLVGAGPGLKDAISQRGLKCVQSADVIIYDDLISPSVLNEAPLTAELIYVGKRKNSHAMEQENINSLLVKKAFEGGYVVRLKGGDPFIFGRGGEEALALKEQNIPYEIVPGISSAYSVPAFAGIPVTHRTAASSVHIITGHEGKHKKNDCIDYTVLAREEGTLIFLMGLTRLEEIAGKLIEGGKKAETPAAVIQSGTTARQRTVTGSLQNIAQKVKAADLKTPAVIVVGDAVKLHEQLDWQQTLPLSGKRILLTGTRKMIAQLEKYLAPLGAETINISLVETRKHEPNEQEQSEISYSLNKLSSYSWIVFASAAAVNAFFSTMSKLNIDRRSLSNVSFAVVGSSTAQELSAYGYYADFVPSKYTSEALANEWIPKLNATDRCLLVRGNMGADTLQNALAEKNIFCGILRLYDTVIDSRRSGEVCRVYSDTDYAVIASGSAARALKESLEPLNILNEARELPKVVVIGPETAKICGQAGIKVDLTAKEYTAEGIAQAILDDVGNGEGNENR